MEQKDCYPTDSGQKAIEVTQMDAIYRLGRLARRAGLLGILWCLVGSLPTTAETEHRSEILRPGYPLYPTLSFTPPLGNAADYLPAVPAVADTYLVLRLSERALYLYQKETLIQSYPVAVGRTGWETPTGRFAIFQMQQNPAWEHPFTGDIVPPGDDNPLGQRWLGFWSDGRNAIGFHGTPEVSSIGKAASHGCVRLHNRDVIELYDQVSLGTPVYVVP
jgi:lipoprotein-anchoring transpeptidase ErfK/SrfK